MDDRSIRVAKAIVSCHETYPPKARPNYAQLAVLRDGPSKSLQTTFGAHQATDAADSLDKILVEYRRRAIAAYALEWEERTLADELAVYLPRLAENSPSSCKALAQDETFLGLLTRSAADPLMAEAQEAVFEKYYMRPAIAAVEGSEWTEPLSLAVVYDSMIHGSFAKLRDKVHEQTERQWIRSYIAIRHHHLANAGRHVSIFGNPLLRATTYRMRTFSTAVAQDNWKLVTPIATGNGVRITEDDVAAWRTA